MILSFRDEGTEDIFNGENTKAARKVCSQSLWKIAARKLDQLDSVTELNELRIPPGNRSNCCPGIAQDNIAFVLTINIESASRGVRLVPSKLKSLITTEKLRSTL
jgi:plasmid maintenance system killer protein